MATVGSAPSSARPLALLLLALAAHGGAALVAPPSYCKLSRSPHLTPLRGGSGAQRLSGEQVKSKLLELGQEHLFEGLSEDQQEGLLSQAVELNSQLPGGLEGYVSSARRLLRESAEGVNPFDGFAPSVPTGEVLDPEAPEYIQMEAAGQQELKHAGFVLVAGGLGERLGYDGIKVSLPLYEAERRCFLHLYISHILDMQRRGGGGPIPLAIMTSGDTHDLTVALLAENANFGMEKDQITVMRQNKVPALVDARARFAASGGLIDTKPHGHGDVHTLMHQHGVVKAWAGMGVKWVVFFQDTNSLIFRSLPAILGVSATRQFDVNSVCVPRTPGEAVGGICRLEHPDGRRYTVNVEYNQLDPLLRSSEGFGGGDVAGESGYSPFPGNINILVFGLDRYQRVLQDTGGRMSEFVNPKYADGSKTAFKKPARLECMMQDFPLLLPPDASVGFTQLDRWLCFSPVKNRLADAAAKAASGLPPECAGTAEADAMRMNARILSMSGVSIPLEGSRGTYGGVPLSFPPLVMLLPSFGTGLTDINSRIGPDADVEVSGRSALLLEGEVNVEGRLHLDGALEIRAVSGASVTVRSLTVRNDGWAVRAATQQEQDDDEMVRMRGYKVDKKETRVFVFDTPGEFVIDE
uniref:UTP-monosaccharide-1-phosphate uridylyltransferase n=1 Tax=Hemiselmis tepida TaxID=464990 RepID=A0A7S0YY33_9CRYP|mmetsp:Transcript_35735/g.91263  ORF Transcript_35735/g.91263 Transcript_35735/m.91263 type:complete len:637 (+) Transcript_35735:128-2038(+)